MRIRGLTAVTLSVLVIMALVFLTTGLWFTEKLEGDSTKINLAGQCRYRTYKIAYLIERLYRDDQAANKEEIKKEIFIEAEYVESILKGFIRGDRGLGLVKEKDITIVSAMSQNYEEWKKIRGIIEDLIQAPKKDFIRDYKDFNREMLPGFERAVNSTVLFIERISSAKIARYKVNIVIFFFFSFVMFGFIFNIVFVRIFKPISYLTEGIERIKSGDFDFKVEVVREDEFGELADYFNKMTQSIKEASLRYHNLVEALPVSVCELDRDGTILYLNKFCMEITGYGEGEVVGKKFISFIPQDSRKETEELFKRILDEKSIVSGFQTAVTLKQRQGLFELNVSPIIVGRDVTGFRCVTRDVEEEKLMIDELVRAKAEAEKNAEKLEKTVRDLEEFSLIAVRREKKMSEIREKLSKEKPKGDDKKDS